MAINRDQAQRGVKVKIPTRKTYYDQDDITHSGIVQIAKDLNKDFLLIKCCEDGALGFPDKVTLVLHKNDSGDHFSLQDLELY